MWLGVASGLSAGIAAVIGVPAGSRIQICPRVYPEQVTITQPLTLEGIGSGNANRANKKTLLAG